MPSAIRIIIKTKIVNKILIKFELILKVFSLNKNRLNKSIELIN
jgi:hypothetical protein